MASGTSVQSRNVPAFMRSSILPSRGVGPSATPWQSQGAEPGSSWGGALTAQSGLTANSFHTRSGVLHDQRIDSVAVTRELAAPDWPLGRAARQPVLLELAPERRAAHA